MSPAYNPETNWFYLVAQEGCGINTKSRDTFRPGGNSFMATGYIESPEEPWQMYIRALDVTTGKIMWEYKQENSRRYGAGLLSTAGGLIFIGAARDSIFRAFDTKTGQELWSVKTPEVAHANPITYMGKDGKQYVTIAAGSTLLTYKLP